MSDTPRATADDTGEAPTSPRNTPVLPPPAAASAPSLPATPNVPPAQGSSPTGALGIKKHPTMPLVPPGAYAPPPTGQPMVVPSPTTGQYPTAAAPTTGQHPAYGRTNRTNSSPPAAMPGQTTATMFTSQSMPAMQFPTVGSTLTSARGQYVVMNVLGSGEFGAVYECVGPFDQTYAVKMVRPANRPYAEVQAEWAREVSRLTSLRHPNIVYIHDAFEQNYLFYLALEKCDHPLKEMFGTPMNEGLVIELTRQLLAALQFLHDQDIVHDDLHGGNVLITHTDRPIVKISDFGISTELRGLPAIRPNVVHHAIMAPEILASGYTSKQSDIYQTGLLLYEMLTGEPAIPKDLGYQELMRYVAEGIPRKRAELIGTPLSQYVSKMLRRRETYRYSSPREVWANLRELPSWKERQLFPLK